MLSNKLVRPTVCTVCLLVGAPITSGQGLQNEAFSGDPAKQTTWGKPVDGVLAGIELKSQKDVIERRKEAKGIPELSALEPVLIKCRVQNQSGRAINLHGSAVLRVYRFVITGPTGKEAPLTEYGKLQKRALMTASNSVNKLSSGEIVADEIYIGRIYDMTLAGEYRVSFSRNVLNPDNFAVTSNVLTIRIRNPR